MNYMSKKERVIACINRQEIDRPPVWVGMPTTHAEPELCRFAGTDNMRQWKQACDDDIWAVSCHYNSDCSKLIEAPFDFTQKGEIAMDASERTLTEQGCFAECEDIEAIEKFPWPDPEKHIDQSACVEELDAVPEGYAKLGVIWSPHFQLACSAFGMEEALIKMKIEPEIFKAVIDRITKFYLRAGEIYFEATKGKLDAILIGNDFGTQNGLLTSPDDLREFVFGGTKQMIEQAHSYGVKVIHHSCGAISEVIPDLIACGADVIHPIQAAATNMQAEKLKQNFGNKVSFCGGIDAQHLLVNGSAGEVAERTRQLAELFKTGLILSPSHEALLPDIPPKNIKAFLDLVHTL